jgi:hypothetical protein
MVAPDRAQVYRGPKTAILLWDLGLSHYTVIDSRGHRSSSAHVVVRASIPPFPSWQSVPIASSGNGAIIHYYLVVYVIWSTTVTLVEVSACAVFLLLLLERGTVEVVEHQIHVRSLLYLKVFDYRFISVDLDPNVRVVLSRKGARLVEHLCRPRLVGGVSSAWVVAAASTHLTVLDASTPLGLSCGVPRPFLLLLVELVADIEGLSSYSRGHWLLVGEAKLLLGNTSSDPVEWVMFILCPVMLYPPVWVKSLLVFVLAPACLVIGLLLLTIVIEVVRSCRELGPPRSYPTVAWRFTTCVQLLLLQCLVRTSVVISWVTIAHALLIDSCIGITIKESGTTIVSDEAATLFNSRFGDLTCLAVNKSFVWRRGNLAVAASTSGCWLTLVILAEVLQCLSEITPQLWAVDCARLLLFTVRKVQSCSPGRSPSVELVLLLQHIVAANRPLPLGRGHIPVLDVCPALLLLADLHVDIVSALVILLLLPELADGNPLSSYGHFLIIAIFLIDLVPILNVGCILFILVSTATGLAATRYLLF